MGIGPEGRLLAGVAGLATGSQTRPSVDGVDWGSFLHLANAHSLLPLAERTLQANELPDGELTRLRALSKEAGQRNLVLASDLLSVHRALSDGGVTAVPFKGPVLAQSFYGNIALRPSVDLDFIVPEPEVQRARAVLEDLGFVGGPPGSTTPPYLRYQNEFSMVRASDGRLAELQWAIAPRYFTIPLDLTTFVPRLTAVEFGGRTLPSFSDEDLLFLLLIHGGKHLWERLIWVCDIAKLVSQSPAMDWDKVLGPARDARVVRMVLLGLRLALRLQADVPVPNEVLRTLRADQDVESLAKRIWARTLTGDPSLGTPPFRTLDLLLREDLRDRATICWRLATTTTEGDRAWATLPEQFSFAYPALRPVRLALKYIRPR